MIKGKKYPYQKRTKQIGLYLPIEMIKTIEKYMDEGESFNRFIKRAIANYIGYLIHLNKKEQQEI